MEAAEAKVQKVLEGSKQFMVPHYQRPYSWVEKQWEVLWKDLIELIQEPEAKPHFLGSIVTAPARSIPEGVEKRLLIDGQQRLTTLLILLTLIRERATATGNGKLADRIGDLITNRHEEGNDLYKLLPTEGETAADGDRDAFIALAQGNAPVSSSKILAARNYFRNKLLRADAPAPEDLFKTISAKLTMVSIKLDERDNPHRIFESLNGKGRPLSQADLIRNYFFMRMETHLHEPSYRTLWQPMQKRLGEETLTEFIRHYLMQSGTIVNESDVYSTLKDRIDSSGKPAIDHLKNIATFSTYYDVLLHPEKAPSTVLRDRLARLVRLEVTVAYPFLLPTYSDFAQGGLTQEDLCALLDVVETYVVRRFVCGEPTYALNKIFTPLYQQAKRQPAFGEAVKLMLAQRSCPRDQQFRERLGSARLYGGGERREKTKLLLERLDAGYGHKERADTGTATIEHVMPQKLTDWWKEHLGDEWEDDHESLLHTLGNLTLTGYNSELSNESYPEKQKLFAASHIELNRYFEDVPTWNTGEIERRADVLSDLALTIWPYFGPQDAVEPSATDSDVTSTIPRNVFFRGQDLPVRSWIDVLTVTLEAINRVGPDDFQRVMAELPRIVNIDPGAFRKARRLRRLSNGAFLETNFSASAIHRICVQALEVVGIGPDEWRVDYTSLRSDDESAEDGAEAPSQVKQLQQEFWTHVRHALAATEKFSSLRSPPPRYWYNISLGRSGFVLSLTASVGTSEVAVKFQMDEEVAPAMDILRQDQIAIEREIGTALEWNTHPDNRRKTIKLRHAVNISDRGTWPDAVEWLARYTIAMKTAFAPRIVQLDV
jgi:hypothetical protein